MKLFLALILACLGWVSTPKLHACDCAGVLPDWSLQEVLKSNDLIFVGRVDSIQTGQTHCMAWFSGGRLYHGVASSTLAIRHDCSSLCRVPFVPGETWLVYAQKDSLSGKLTAHYCGRSRRRPSLGQSDAYVIASRLSWEEEIAKLDRQIPRKDFADEASAQAIAKGELRELDPRRPLNYPEGMEKVWLLLASAVGMLLIWLLLRKFLN